MPSIGLFRKSKKEGEEKTESPPSPENKANTSKTYLKAMPLRELSDLETIKKEVKSGNVLILRITPLASKSIEDVKRAVNELYEFAESIGGDIARLGEERIVLCPQNIKIWREKQPVSKETVPTAA
ncbi:MAG: cell division protein SepF [Candidatus Bathyarchaeota archaeon]|nr:cell division protein SepF [Candidatus Bathyarchaeota archaeon]